MFFEYSVIGAVGVIEYFYHYSQKKTLWRLLHRQYEEKDCFLQHNVPRSSGTYLVDPPKMKG